MQTALWETLIADRSLGDLPYRVETNRRGQIILSPISNWHSDCQTEVALRLGQLLPGGRVSLRFAIQTADGVRAPDVIWVSKERRQAHGRTVVFPVAPEICVEVLFPSNRREAMLEKMTLYFAKGAQEVWLCDEEGKMEFFSALSAPDPIPASLLCPDFPQQVFLG